LQILTSTLIVRIISKAVYYLINGKIVFYNKGRINESISKIRYYILIVIQISL